MPFAYRHYRSIVAAASLVVLAACGSDATGPTPLTGFLAGTSSDHEIGLVVNSLGKSVTMFQLGNPTVQRQIPLGASSSITPTGLSVQGRRAAVPLGNTASIALVDLQSASIVRYFTFASGNATGSAFADDTTIIATNPNLGLVGRMTVGQSADSITTLAKVTGQPTAVVVTGGRALVVSSILDANYAPVGNGIVTALDPKTLAVIGTMTTGGQNSTDAALGPDGLLYVLNTGDYVGQSSITIVNPSTLQAVATIGGMGVGAGAISIDANGLAYISGYAFGTLVWSTKTRTFVRGLDNPVCAKLATGGCRGAFAATTSASGDLYQLFFGSPSQNLPPYAFVYRTSSYTLSDSVAMGAGPAAIAIRSF